MGLHVGLEEMKKRKTSTRLGIEPWHISRKLWGHSLFEIMLPPNKRVLSVIDTR